MSTRAMYSFTDQHETFHVYKHHDGYPSGAAEFIHDATKKAWDLPRFEANEFAASFVAANKTNQGGVRLMPTGTWEDVAPGDIEYRYEIFMKGKELWVKGYKVDCWGTTPKQEQIINSSLKSFCTLHKISV